MMRSIAFMLFVILTGATSAAEPPDVRGAVQKGLTFLAKDAVTWKSERKCSSCHHAPMSIWSLNEGKNRGYSIDEAALTELTAWVLDPADPAKIFPMQEPKEPLIVNQSPLMLALGMAAGNLDSDAARDGLRKMVTTVMGQQRPDGSWGLFYVWEPFGPTQDVISSWALLSLSTPAAAKLVPEAKEAREKGLAWLATTKAGSELQSMAIRPLLAKRVGQPEAEWQPHVEPIIGRQNQDGGWSQNPDQKSDAYATGVALYVLGEIGVAPDHPAMIKGRDYLIATQLPGGSWEMASRAGGPKGESAKNPAPIAFAGTAWAVMGLMRCQPDPTKVPQQ